MHPCVTPPCWPGPAGPAGGQRRRADHLRVCRRQRQQQGAGFYNSGSQVLDLSAYRVEFYFNGASAAGRSIDLSGSLAPGKTFVLANGVADPALLALASQRVEGSWFNGNDAVLLRRSGEILDSLGQVGFNPGTTWGSGDVQTLDRSLVRKADIRDGDSDPSDAFDPAAQWLGYPRDTFANLGQHGAGEPAAAGEPACDRSTRCRAPALKVRW